MKYPTVLSLLCAFCFISASALPLAAGHPTMTDPISCEANCTSPCNGTHSLQQLLFSELLIDQLIDGEDSIIKIEFEFHDLFVNERILSYELIAKYQQILYAHDITPGPQRQIHLHRNGRLVVGDFAPNGQLLVSR